MLDTLLAYLPDWVQNLSTVFCLKLFYVYIYLFLSILTTRDRGNLKEYSRFETLFHSQFISKVILVVHGVLGFIAGYLTQQLSVTIYTVGIGFILSCIFVLPPWPFYRRNPLNVCFILYNILFFKILVATKF